MEAAARAAAVSAATSVPGELELIWYVIRDVSMSSGRSQQLWSVLGSPTWNYISDHQQIFPQDDPLEGLQEIFIKAVGSRLWMTY
jgi:hypothetical protein